MITDNPDARLITLGLEYERFAVACDKLNGLALSDPKELEREEERLFEEGHRFRQAFSTCPANSPEGVAVLLQALRHCLSCDGRSAADCARHAESTADALLWQIADALLRLRHQADIAALMQSETVARRA